MNHQQSVMTRAAAAMLLAAAVVVGQPALAANPPANPQAQAPNNAANPANSTNAATAEYVPLGTASFGPNDHGSYAWFIEVKTRQVVMCLVHNPQSAIECKRLPIPPP
ncbi:hypothetical protein HPT27_00650 [Permianibacter sp. IMCC34836]|uniref:hypothetical protein n=1 Tax=Permianibacter fluminis TaxID=2738515 RepID=UPI0015552F9D|nr:hypothetical protein [Permianibacter fluminis]NQD35510.1 hypothetical protein [Permianibacter fluminis]